MLYTVYSVYFTVTLFYGTSTLVNMWAGSFVRCNILIALIASWWFLSFYVHVLFFYNECLCNNFYVGAPVSNLTWMLWSNIPVVFIMSLITCNCDQTKFETYQLSEYMQINNICTWILYSTLNMNACS